MTQEQKDFISNNNAKMTCKELADEIGLSYQVVYNYCYQNKIETKNGNGYGNVVWVFDYWNHGLNPITMRKENY